LRVIQVSGDRVTVKVVVGAKVFGEPALGADADEGVRVTVEGDSGEAAALSGTGIGAGAIVLRGRWIEVRCS
jgi:hypothetical protein